MPFGQLRSVLLALGTACVLGLMLAGSASAVTFSPASFVPQGPEPYQVISGDFNGDGFADLASANLFASSVSVRLGDGAGGFPVENDFSVGANPFSVASGDFNGDGFLDLASANYNSNDVTVLLGDGTGSFSLGGTFPLNPGANPYSIISADYNGDGKPDLATANATADNVSVLLGDGSGGFGTASNYAVGDNPHRVASADFDGDGNQDIVAANADAGSLSVLLGDGSGSFSAATTLPLGPGLYPLSVIAADFNGDGFPDLATANIANNVSVLLGDGTGGFGPPTEYVSFPFLYTTEVITADFNGDGRPDLGAVNIAHNTLAVLLGDGSGGFGPSTQFPVGAEPQSLISGDFNGDGMADVATASVNNRGASGFSILLNSSGPPPIADVKITKTAAPTNARPGDVVTYTLKAKNIGTAVANNVVVTDALPVGLSFVSADSPCVQASGTVTCPLGSLNPNQEVTLEVKVKVDPWGTANPAGDHLLAVQRVEAQIDLNAGEQKTVSVDCPSGFFAADGSVRIDHIDQGAGDWPTPQVLESRASGLGTWQGTVKNTATGRAQAKIFAVCIRQTTVDGTHTHNLIVSAPVTVTTPVLAGPNTRSLQCGPGQVAVQPGFISSTPADLIYSQPDGNGWKFTLDNHAPANVTFSIRCMTRQVAFAGGHTHDLKLERITHDFVVDPGKVNEAQLTCADGSKGIVAGWDLDHGLLSLGNDPRPVTRAFKLYNPTNTPLHARLSLLCLGDRTAGEHLAPQSYINTASVSTSSPEAGILNNSSSATVTAEDTDNFTPVPNPPTVKPTPNNPTGHTRISGLFIKKSGVSATITCSGACSGTAKLFSLKSKKQKSTLLAAGNYKLNAAGSKKIKLKIKGKKAKQVLTVSGRVSIALSNGTSQTVSTRSVNSRKGTYECFDLAYWFKLKREDKYSVQTGGGGKWGSSGARVTFKTGPMKFAFGKYRKDSTRAPVIDLYFKSDKSFAGSCPKI